MGSFNLQSKNTLKLSFRSGDSSLFLQFPFLCFRHCRHFVITPLVVAVGIPIFLNQFL